MDTELIFIAKGTNMSVPSAFDNFAQALHLVWLMGAKHSGDEQALKTKCLFGKDGLHLSGGPDAPNESFHISTIVLERHHR